MVADTHLGSLDVPVDESIFIPFAARAASVDPSTVLRGERGSPALADGYRIERELGLLRTRPRDPQRVGRFRDGRAAEVQRLRIAER